MFFCFFSKYLHIPLEKKIVNSVWFTCKIIKYVVMFFSYWWSWYTPLNIFCHFIWQEIFFFILKHKFLQNFEFWQFVSLDIGDLNVVSLSLKWKTSVKWLFLMIVSLPNFKETDKSWDIFVIITWNFQESVYKVLKL